MSDTLLKEPAFTVEQHNLMFLRVAGKDNTVLTLERNIYTWNIYEYTDPLIRGRSWWYDAEDFGLALTALLAYLEVAAATEPQGWLRADDFDEQGRPRCRRAYVEVGERVITVDGEE